MAKGHPDRNATQAEPRLSWTLPQDWREVGPGQMSLRTFVDQRRKFLLAYKPPEGGPAKPEPGR